MLAMPPSPLTFSKSAAELKSKTQTSIKVYEEASKLKSQAEQAIVSLLDTHDATLTSLVDEVVLYVEKLIKKPSDKNNNDQIYAIIQIIQIAICHPELPFLRAKDLAQKGCDDPKRFLAGVQSKNTKSISQYIGGLSDFGTMEQNILRSEKLMSREIKHIQNIISKL